MTQTYRLDDGHQTLVLASAHDRLPQVVYWGSPLPDGENLEEICVKVVNQHLYTTHTKYEPKQTNTKVVWCIHLENLGLDPLTVAAGWTL